MVSENQILTWAEERGLLGEHQNPVAQASKMLEEAVETLKAVVAYEYIDEDGIGEILPIIDGIGDVWVTLVILAAQYHTSLDACTCHAWEEIKDRTGKTQGGMFVKDGGEK
jgi:hypothetical protein